MTEQAIKHLDPVELARELNRCRQHGLADLDLNLHHKLAVPPEEIAHLEHLARAYCTVIGVMGPRRDAAILRLVQDGLVAYTEQGDSSDSAFVEQFFFDRSGGAAVPREDSPVADPPAAPPTRKGVSIKQLATDLQLSEKRLAELRDAAFIRFAAFLITYVADRSRAVPTPPVPEVVTAAPGSPPSPPRHHWSLLRWVSAGLAGLVVASSLFVAVWLLSHPGAAQSPTTVTVPTATTSHHQPGKTYPETAGAFGVPTFTDPRTVSGAGPKIQPNQQVQVTCKVLAPSIPSVSPDGYWYLITSPPWSGGYYAAANAFMNGDHVGQTTPLHNTDRAVPDCPAQ